MKNKFNKRHCRLVLRFWILAFVALGCADFAIAIDRKKYDEAVRALAKPLEEDRVFYRWQSTKSGENLDRVGKMTRDLDRYFMNLKQDIAAGPGIYMAGNPFSSSAYLPRQGGNLLEIRIPKGTAILDVTDRTVIQKLKSMGLSPDRLSNGKISESVLILYSSDWYVGKNLKGRAEFELFPGKHHTVDGVYKLYNRVQSDRRAQSQMFSQIVGRRPDIIEELARDPKLGDTLAARALSGDQIVELIRSELPLRKTSFTSNLTSTLLAMPDHGQSLLKDPILTEQLKKELMENSLGYDFARVSVHFPPDWAADFMKGARNPDTFFQNYLREIRELETKEFVDKIKALSVEFRKTNLSGFSMEVRDALAHEVAERMSIARVKKSDIGRLQELTTKEFLNAEAAENLHKRLARAKAYISNYNQMSTKPNLQVVQATLREVESLDELDSLVDYLRSQKSPLLKQAISDDLTLFSRLLDKAPPPIKLLLVSSKLTKEGVDVYNLTINRIAEMSPNTRKIYIAECLDWAICRKAMKNNWVKLLDGVEDLGFLSNSISNLRNSAAPRDVEREIFAAIRTPEQLKTFKLLQNSKMSSADILAKIEQIGWGRFRPQAVYSLLSVRQLSSAARKDVMLKSIESVVNPQDASVVKEALEKEGLQNTELGRILDRKMISLQPNSVEIENYNSTGKRKLSAAPQEDFDCLSSWARSLRSK